MNIDSQSVLATIWRLNYNLVEPNPPFQPTLQSLKILEAAYWNSFAI